MPSHHECYRGDCRTKVALATSLLVALAERPRHQDTAQSLARLEDRSRELAAQMRAMALGQLCTTCAAKPGGGGCCSRVMADEVDAIQLLMNLLVGVPVAVGIENGIDCCFLGERGCLFAIKPIFCLNYDCAAIRDGCPRAERTTYERLRGRLLQEQWRLEQCLLSELTALGVR